MQDTTPMQISQIEDLTQRVLSHQQGKRQLVAIFGAPGSGKSTLVERLCASINAKSAGSCAIVPMDGFHLDDAILRERGLLPRKGAPETFDIEGFIHLHRRLSDSIDESIAVPLFDRDMELSRAAARFIPQSVQTVLIEGNYLLLQQPGWVELAQFYGLTIQLDVPVGELERRLMERWDDQGLSPQEAHAKVHGNDMLNAKLILSQSQAPDVLFAAHDSPANPQ